MSSIILKDLLSIECFSIRGEGEGLAKARSFIKNHQRIGFKVNRMIFTSIGTFRRLGLLVKIFIS